MARLNNLTGNRYGRLVVIKRANDYITPSGRHYVQWLCRCDCGNTTIVIGDALVRHKTKSCGCYRNDKNTEKFSTHGESNNNKLYGVWCSMKTRCYNRNSQYYSHYGGRGITVHDSWRNNYIEFKEWAIKNGYQEGLTIDRIDVNGNYCPENCRWVDRSAQANNRRSNILCTLNGETHNLTEWSKITGISYSKLNQRFHAGWDVKRMLTQ